MYPHYSRLGANADKTRSLATAFAGIAIGAIGLVTITALVMRELSASLAKQKR
jgi:hypothetical protein